MYGSGKRLLILSQPEIMRVLSSRQTVRLQLLRFCILTTIRAYFSNNIELLSDTPFFRTCKPITYLIHMMLMNLSLKSERNYDSNSNSKFSLTRTDLSPHPTHSLQLLDRSESCRHHTSFQKYGQANSGIP